MSTLQVQKTNAIKAYKNADEAGRQLLVNLFGEMTFAQKITERVKAFVDACAEVGEDPLDEKFSTGTTDEIAFKKLKVIAKALNEGVILDYSNASQYKWYPWFKFSGSGFRFYVAYYDCTHTHTAGGSRLCFHSKELAEYAGTQFIDLYNDLLL